jgi:D-glycero-beta-D-manno-heptose-7-phosphate kinase
MRATLLDVIRRFPEKRILVVGDLILDEFVWGKVSRISPEAPVPVVDVVGESYYPGGAGNVARNLVEFTKHVSVMGLTGTDPHAAHLVGLLEGAGIGTGWVQRSAASPAIVKTRIIARHQQVVRVDRERRLALTAEQTGVAIRQIGEAMRSVDAVIVADYGKGFVNQRIADELSRAARETGKVVAVDPNPHNPLRWDGVTAIKPNRGEAFAAAGMPASEPVEPVERDERLLAAGEALLGAGNAGLLLITLGEQGMVLFERGRAPYHTPTRAKEVFDVSGAGDTAISLFTLALCSGAPPADAAEIANHASGVVVGKLGTATLTPAELEASLSE